MAIHGIGSDKFHKVAWEERTAGSPFKTQAPAEQEKSIFDKFDDWTNQETQQDEFKMFDINLSTYSKDLKDFAQGYIDKFDADEDSNMSFEEFVNMASNGEFNPKKLSVASELFNLYESVYQEQIMPSFDNDKDGSLNLNEFMAALGHNPATISEQTKKDVKEVFDSYNYDNVEGNENELLNAGEVFVGSNPTVDGIKTQDLLFDKQMNDFFKTQYAELDLDGDGQVSSGEFASMLYAADVDWDNFNATGGDVASSIDGKLNWTNYQDYTGLNSSTEKGQDLLFQRQAFFGAFYAN